MKKQVGLWIDHREAVIVVITAGGEEIKKMISGMEKHVRFKGTAAAGDRTKEDMRDRQFENHLNNYYDQVIAAIRDADAIQVFGPGEAKGELIKRLEHEGIREHVIAIDTAGKLTDHQIAARVRERFSARASV